MNERNKQIDYAKAIGILLVILNHCAVPSRSIVYFVAAFHIPLFFFISGRVNQLRGRKESSLKEFALKKFKSLIIPYFFFSLIDFIVFYICNPISLSGKGCIWQQLVCFALGMRNLDFYVFTGALWFLTSLFSCEIVGYIYEKKLISRRTFWLVYVLFSVYVTRNPMALPMNTDVLPYVFVFYLLGRYNQTEEKNRENISTRKVIIHFCIELCIVFYISKTNYAVDIYSSLYKNPFLFMLGGIIGSLMIMDLSEIIVRIEKKMKVTIPFLNFIGRSSIFFMGIHQQWILIVMQAFNIKIGENYIWLVSQYFICLILCYMITWVALFCRSKRDHYVQYNHF